MEEHKMEKIAFKFLFTLFLVGAVSVTNSFGTQASNTGHNAIAMASNDMNQNSVKETVTGTVTDAQSGETLPGVTIQVKGTTTGTITDNTGRYELTVPSLQDTLVFSFIGYKTQTVPINGRTTINIQLQTTVVMGQQLVVTALGIKQQENSISFATQNVPTEELTRVKTNSFVTALQGKSAGVFITKGTSGPGSSSRIIIRGEKSFTGNSAPLYVINGVPIGQGAGDAGGGGFFTTTDEGNPLSDINPEDIESIQVLKGASAAALYGSQAANGVILITTKKGRAGQTKVNVYSTTQFSTPIFTPSTQTSYGRTDPSANDSWGAKVSDADNSFIKDFFNTGVNLVNGVAVSGGNDLVQFRASYENTHTSGIVTSNRLLKNNISISGSGHFLNDKLNVYASMMHVKRHLKNPPRSGFYFSPTLALYTFPTDDDFSNYNGQNYKVWDETRGLYLQNWPYMRNEASTNQNPYWIMYRDPLSFFRNRTLMQFKVAYDFTDWLSLQGRTTLNLNHNRNFQKFYAGTDPVNVGSAGTISGTYNTALDNSRSWYSDFLLHAAGDVSESINLDGTIGFSNSQGHSYGLSMGANGDAGMIYANVFTVTNFVSPAIVSGAPQFNYGEYEYKSLSQALFGTFTIGYKNTVFLNATGRNEWSYTSPESFFYPSVGLSYVITNTTGTSDVISYAKVRASYAEVGSPLPRGVNDRTPPFSINTATGSVNTDRTLPFFSGTDTTTLVPERTKSFEAGFQLGMFHNKLNVKFTYYDATTGDQIFTIQAPVGSGATGFYINGGSVRNFGIESMISYSSDIGGGVHWNTALNFSHNTNQIREISDRLTADRYQIASSGGSRLVASFLTRPKDGHYGAFGDYYGQLIKRDADGKMVLDDDTGLPILTGRDNSFVGNPNPDFLAGFNNTFSYKNLTLSFLIDGRFGGYVYSLTKAWLDFKGMTKRSAAARDRGYIMINGVKHDASQHLDYWKKQAKSTGRSPAQEYIHQYYLTVSGGGNYPAIYPYRWSATNIRLRQLSIGYTFSNLGNAVDNVKLSLTGRNLLFLYKDSPYDPERSAGPGSASQGLSVFGMPATRSFGINVSITF